MSIYNPKDDDLQESEENLEAVEEKKLYSFSEALKIMMNDEVEMRFIGSDRVKHRCTKSYGAPKQMERSFDGEWFSIDYYHASEIEGQWEVV